MCVTQSECSKQVAGNIHCARREVVLMCECVLCVGNYIPTTAETTYTFSNRNEKDSNNVVVFCHM